MTETTFNVGDRVKVDLERGSYKVKRNIPDSDGSLLLYGGDPNPNGVRGFRSVLADRLTLDKRVRKVVSE